MQAIRGKLPFLLLLIFTLLFISTQAYQQHQTKIKVNIFQPLDLSDASCSPEESFRPITFFGGREGADHDDHHNMFIIQGDGHGNMDDEYKDPTQWSVYPQKSQNAHVVIGVLTVLTMYTWGCNVAGFLQLSKAFMITGITQIAQGLYLYSWLFYLLYPENTLLLHQYVLNDVMELQHMAIALCLLIAGGWDLFTGIFLHYQLPFFMDSYNRKVVKDKNGKTIQPNNLLFYQRYIPLLVTIAHVLNGSNFISHPQHSEDNTMGHVLLGLSMMCGGITFYWVRTRHVCWKYFAQQVNPSLRFESHFQLDQSAADRRRKQQQRQLQQQQQQQQNDMIDPETGFNNNNTSQNNQNITILDNSQIPSDEVWEVGARYSLSDLQDLAARHAAGSNNRGVTRRGGLLNFSWENFDIFHFDETIPPNPIYDDDDDNQDDVESMVDGTATELSGLQTNNTIADIKSNKQNNVNHNTFKPKYFTQEDIYREWNNSSLLNVEYKKFNNKNLHQKYRWNSISNHRIINWSYNITQYLLHVCWYTKTWRELAAWGSAMVSSFNFMFIGWLLMTFIEPPVRLHYQHWYQCFKEYNLVQLTFAINILLSGAAVGYLFLTILHQMRVINGGGLYRISFFQKH
eukprot:UN00926